ncbi:MAG TPA: HDIG domain-containing protein [Euryarchaeota archaeon]|nr:HDIG domain-containing protein [Euryarchaeota archaeon]
MSSTIPSEDECIELLLEAGCKRRVVIHCCTVEAVAKEIVSRVKGADPDLVAAGALLHDIGRSVDHSIMHAYIGSQIVQAHGLPQSIVDIVRKHTGAGLDAEDVEELGLPDADYMPRTLEEKIVAHADNMVSDNKVVKHSHSSDKLRNKGAERGADRIDALHAELSALYGEDLDVIPDRIGQYPDLPLARRYDLI